MAAALALLLLAVDTAQIIHYRQQLQIGADVSVLAGTPFLMDRSPLYTAIVEDLPSQDQAAYLEALRNAQKDAARLNASNFASLNVAARQSIELPANSPDDSVEPSKRLNRINLGWLDDITERNSALAAESNDGALNSMAVSVARTKDTGKPVSLWLLEQVGLSPFDVLVKSRATVDQRIIGFRQAAATRIPLLPIMVLPSAGDQLASATELPNTWWGRGEADNFLVNENTDSVTQDSNVDNIAEMVLRIESDSPMGMQTNTGNPRDAGILPLGPPITNQAEFARAITSGFTIDDLTNPTYGLVGDFTIREADEDALPAQLEFSNENLKFLRACLLSIRGQERIFVIGDEATAVSGTFKIPGFVAGRIVDVNFDNDGSLLITIQPCLLQTPTALIGSVPQRNPWIGKLVLSK